MRNTLGDLNNHLFEQLERLNDEELTEGELQKEIQRSKSIEGVAKQIIENGRLVLDSHKFADDRMDADTKVPRMLDVGED
ncbi:hypothetical protein [Staphylococcus saprophyticus]|uniref:hypothetical protein n=1 Tax=Staphylococcus saprophyticus TaxID=29385 RepID=UPI00101247C8|nr:hypothetical protein [Staphylococcus saprophyticus]MDW3983137.1 hypothetical protein [Staphylococcus saprophyticus]MDW4066490.1 hypothetical protein [Staphylococcus saprophyticus]MDW4137151.1 hypothetical protein [Staphylococcus saprophyticus]MDW4214032.1 hypothetical protein [Staphylococcus saprophyticus]MDW4349951.1 hypothetical protein [Staphylococcus saprophyticus]